jgi:hypothetical protein
MALIKLTEDQRRAVRKRLVKWHQTATRSGRYITTAEAHRELFAAFSDLGIAEVNIPVGRATKPNYAELGMTRKAGQPTDEDKRRYTEVTRGGTLTDEGLVVQALLFDNDLITDRSAVMSYQGLVDLHQKYLGRANDFNHSFDANDARCRIIDLGLGSDPNTRLHEDRPDRGLLSLSNVGPNASYTALWATLAFPFMEGDTAIERVKNGLILDESIAFRTGPGQDLCSECLKPLQHSMCYTECEEHGFVGGRTEEGSLIVSIMNGVADAFTFGLVSDGAIKRAGLVTDPTH